MKGNVFMNITIFTAEELYAMGFSFKHYSENVHRGMVYYYNDEEWIIGGRCDADFTDDDMKIISDGIWLPSQEHLLEWLEDNDFVYSIVNTDGFYDVDCKDSHTNTLYHSKTPTLEVALASIIKKILKKKERTFDYKEKIFGTIISD